MKYVEHDDKYILIPRHISNICVYTTCPVILLSSMVCFWYQYYLLAFLEFCTFLTSIAHWKKIKHIGIERKLDICCLATTLSYATYTSFLMPQFYTYLWMTTVTTGTIIFYKNEQLFYYQVLQYNNKIIDKSVYKGDLPFHYFSIEYTNPHTFEREIAYYRNVITHGVTLHIGFCLASMYCIIYNPL